MDREKFKKEIEIYLDKKDKTPLWMKIFEMFITIFVWVFMIIAPIIGIISYFTQNILFRIIGWISYVLWVIIIFRVISNYKRFT